MKQIGNGERQVDAVAAEPVVRVAQDEQVAVGVVEMVETQKAETKPAFAVTAVELQILNHLSERIWRLVMNEALTWAGGETGESVE